jgi:hypothetical protein
MGCKYSRIDGMCEIYDERVDCGGVDDEGFCICEDDPDPTVLCENYESDED